MNKRGNKKGTRVLSSEIYIDICPKSKRSQVTLFIIVAIVIVALGVLIYLLYPKIKVSTEFDVKNPNAFIQTCLEDEMKNAVNTLSLQGGSMNPEHYYLYQDNKIEYLCYTNEDYAPCVVQQPMLVQHIESELQKEIAGKAEACFQDLKSSYENRGYSVNLKKGDMVIELLPERIVATFNNELTLTKGETENYKSFSVILHNNLYELVSIADSIIGWEATYGDSETTAYMNYYHNLKVEKLNQLDGSTIYILTNRDNGNQFQFASRSVAWAPGI